MPAAFHPHRRNSNPLLTTVGIFLLGWGLIRFTQILRQSEPQFPDQASVVVVRVVDGDTLLMEGGERVRLLGIDTPETKHPTLGQQLFGPEATEFTKRLVEGKSVTLLYDKERYDDYRRTLAFVFLKDGRFLNEEIVLQGLATAEPQYPFRSDFKKRLVEAEKIAQANHRGLWGNPKELFSK